MFFVSMNSSKLRDYMKTHNYKTSSKQFDTFNRQTLHLICLSEICAININSLTVPVSSSSMLSVWENIRRQPQKLSEY